MKLIIFRVDSSYRIGSGHVSRCIELAKLLNVRGIRVLFLCRELKGHLIADILNQRFRVIKMSERKENGLDAYSEDSFQWLGCNEGQDAKDSISALRNHGIFQAEAVVVDHYAIGEIWHQQLRSIVKKIIVIDDLANRQYDLDLLIDQNYFVQPHERYQGKAPLDSKLLLGPKYSLLRTDFGELRRQVRPRSRIMSDQTIRFCLFFGGADIPGMTVMTLKALKRLTCNWEADVVIGRQNTGHREIEQVADGCSNIRLHCPAASIGHIYAEADIGIGAGGVSTWERLCLGLPSAVIAIAPNQVATAVDLAKGGFHRYLGYFESLTEASLVSDLNSLMDGPDTLIQYSQAGMNLVDGKGGQRISDQIWQIVS